MVYNVHVHCSTRRLKYADIMIMFQLTDFQQNMYSVYHRTAVCNNLLVINTHQASAC